MIRKNKHRAVKKTLVLKGVKTTFASSGEALRAMYLVAREQEGEIESLSFHPEFILFSPFKRGKLVSRGAKYTADFLYNEGGINYVEDFKSADTARKADYILRRKLFLIKHCSDDLRFREVFLKGKKFIEKDYF